MALILAVACLIATVVAIVLFIKVKKDGHEELPIYFIAIPLVLTLLFAGGSMIYTQGVGEVVVLKNWGGSLAGWSGVL